MSKLSKQKRCSTCKKKFPRIVRYFYVSKTRYGSVTAECKKCISIRGKKYNRKNSKKRAKCSLEWRQKHPILTRRGRKDYRRRNRVAVSKRKKEWYLKHRDRILAKKRAAYKKNPKKFLKVHRSFRFRYNNIKKAASLRNLPFTLLFDEYVKIVKGKPCYYCGVKIGCTSGGSLDRVNNKRGYTFRNVVVCCTICNRIKYTFSKTIFFKHIRKIAKLHNL